MEHSADQGGLGQGALVSVLIAAYKSGFFGKALESALAQNYRNCEIVICDDSPDSRIEGITREIAQGDVRVRYQRNPVRRGSRGNYLRCLELARGAYVKFLNDDDLLEPECVSRMVEVLSRNEGASLVACRRIHINDKGRALHRPTLPPPLLHRDAVVDGRDLARVLLALGVNWIGEYTAIMFRRGDAAGISPNATSFGGVAIPGFGDFSLSLNLLGKGNLAYIATPLCRIREHADRYRRDPELRREAQESVYTLRVQAARLGIQRETWGLPDLLGWLAGFRYRALDADGFWKRRRPGPIQWLVMLKKWVAAVAWIATREYRLQKS